MSGSYDVIVIGGGHAGCEAAAAAARVGARTALVTQRFDTIGVMSCNPAIGGLGKGHLVREIDSLDGLMGRAADSAGIQFRVLNRRKGPAVQGPRAQADRKLYRLAMQQLIVETHNLTVIEAEASRFVIAGGAIRGLELADGRTLACAALVVATGTFLDGVIHLGQQRTPAGRVGDKPSVELARSLDAAGFALGRLKTGTPPRLDGTTIDWGRLEAQPGDDPPEPFSALTERIVTPQVCCHITRTNLAGHAIVRANAHRTGVYSGAISGRGPRYCPSIEDKVVRFADRDSHQIFLEPEGLDDTTVYPNGISTSLPAEAQAAFVATIPGLEKARIVRPGYAIEYDYVDPRELDASLAAARFDRAESYLGVMIDDLVTRGVSEPYRIFTSRAEYRLSLRADNASERLTDKGIALGCVGLARAAFHRAETASLEAGRAMMKAAKAAPTALAAAGVAINQDGVRRSAFELAAQPHLTIEALARVWPELADIPPKLARRLEADAKYAVYLDRQEADIERHRRSEALTLPPDLDYASLSGLSNELKAKFVAARPASLGQAGRIEGATPAALALIAAHARRRTGHRIDA